MTNNINQVFPTFWQKISFNITSTVCGCCPDLHCIFTALQGCTLLQIYLVMYQYAILKILFHSCTSLLSCYPYYPYIHIIYYTTLYKAQYSKDSGTNVLNELNCTLLFWCGLITVMSVHWHGYFSFYGFNLMPHSKWGFHPLLLPQKAYIGKQNNL